MPRLRFLPSGREISVRDGTRLIDAIREAGLPIAHACGDDLVCARCGIRVLEGSVTRESHTERRVKARNHLPGDERLACALRVHDDVVLWASDLGPLE